MAKFVAKGEYSSNGIRITQNGTEVTDEKIVDFLRSSPDYGVWFHEVLTDKQVAGAYVEEAKRILYSMGIEVPPVDGTITEEDEQDVILNEKIKQEQAKAEEEEKARKKAAAEHIAEKRKSTSKRGAAKKTGAKKK